MENGWKKFDKLRKLKDLLFMAAIFASLAVAVVPLFSILIYVFVRGISALNIAFFYALPTPVGESGGGMGNAILGTFILVLLACIVGLPVGIFGGLWLAWRGQGKRGFIIRYAADVLSSIPTIVIGVFAYVLIVKMVPRSIYEAGLALGLPEWRVMLSIVLRSAWSGIFTGVMLAVARVAGETAPLIFTSFNSDYWNVMIDQPMASLTVQIYNYAISPFADWNAKAWAGSLTLVCMVLGLTLLVRKFSKRVNYG